MSAQDQYCCCGAQTGTDGELAEREHRDQQGHRVEEACPELDTGALRACVAAVWSVDLAVLAQVFGRMTRREPGPGQVEAASWACILHGRAVTALQLEAAAATVNATARRWGRCARCRHHRRRGRAKPATPQEPTARPGPG